MTQGLTKPQIIKQITGSKESVSVDVDEEEGDPQLTLGEVFTEAIIGAKVKSVELPTDTTHMTEAKMNYTLELKRIEMQERESERQERLEMARINV